jgi:RNase H-like domain found in reverse transcriptase
MHRVEHHLFTSSPLVSAKYRWLDAKKLATAVEWSPSMLQAVDDAKHALSKATLLTHPLPGADLDLAVDAFDEHLGAALQQCATPATAWQTLGFSSKKLEPAQVKYFAFDSELLA